MQVPILKQGDFLIVSIQSAVSDTDLMKLRDDLTERAGKHHSLGVIIDVAVLDVLDSFACRTLCSIADILRLRGAKAVIVGIQPEVAFSMVRMGLSLRDNPTALDLEDGLELLRREIGMKNA